MALTALLPVLGLIDGYFWRYSLVADHFQYLASMGIFAGAAICLVALLDRAAPGLRAAGWGLVAAVVVVLGILSNLQSRTYADEPTLYQATLERNPGSWMAHNNLGLWYRNHGEPGKALEHYKEALSLRKDYPQAHNNLGILYEDQGNFEGAAAEFREAIRTTKNYVAAHNNLGNVLAKMPGHGGESIDELREAVRLQPDFASAHNNLGAALSKMPGHSDDAIGEYKEAVRLQPDLASAHANLGNAYSDLPGRQNDAIEEYEWALRLDPDDAEAHSNLGLLLNAAGRPVEAIAEYAAALRLRPAFAEIRFNMALALLSIPGRENEAAQQLEAFLHARPGNETAQKLLAEIRASQP